MATPELTLITKDVYDAKNTAMDSKNATQDTAITAARTNAVADAKTYTDGQVATDRGRLTSIEAKDTEQDGRLNGLVLPNTTNLNTLTTTNNYYIGTPADWVGQNFPINATVRVRSDFWTANDGIQVVTSFGTTQYQYTRIRNSSGFGAWSASNEVRLTAAESLNTAQDGRLTAAETKNTAQDGRLDVVEAKNTAQDGRLTVIESSVIVYGNGYAQPPVAHTTDASTKGLWSFDNALTDSSGNSKTLSQVGTYSGAYGSDGKFGASSLNGGLYQNVGADSFLSSTGAVGGTLTTGTVEGWIRTTAHTGIKVALSHRGWYWIGMAANGTPIAKYGISPNEKTITGTTVLSGASYAAAPWHHLALVFDGAAGVRLYVNGKLEGSNAAVETAGDDLGGGFTVGGLQGSPPAYNWELSTGRIDEVRISNTARYAATSTYPARPAGLKGGGALFIGPSIPADRKPFDQWIMTETA